MEKWLQISGLLCLYGFLRETRPMDPYFIEFTTYKWTNITLEELYRDIIPIETYSYLLNLIIVFLVTDFFRYKPLIIVSGITAIILCSIFIWSNSKLELQISFAMYGTYNAIEVAYLTYIYAKVDKKYYSKVTSHTRMAIFFGRLTASILSQILVYFDTLNYFELVYITLATQILSTISAVFLPSVKTTVYFHREELNKKNESVGAENVTHSTNTSCNLYNKSTSNINPTAKKPNINPFKLIYSHFKNAYTNRYVLQWSIWYSTILCGYFQIYTYIQSLWKNIEPYQQISWNGGVEACSTFLSAACALLAGYGHTDRISHRSSILIVSSLSILKGGALLLATLPKNLYCSYAGYIVFNALYAFSITVSGAEIAKNLEEDSFALVFGVNTFFSLILKTILTVVFVDGNIIVFDLFEQFIVYSCFFTIIGISFFTFVFIESFMLNKER